MGPDTPLAIPQKFDFSTSDEYFVTQRVVKRAWSDLGLGNEPRRRLTAPDLFVVGKIYGALN